MSDETGPDGEVDTSTTSAESQTSVDTSVDQATSTESQVASGKEPEISPELTEKFSKVFDDGKTDDSEGAESQPQTPKPVELPKDLHPILVNAAKRAGWSDDLIASTYATNPQAAVTTLQHLHQAENALSEQFAQIAQFRQQQQPQQQQLPPQQPQTEQFQVLNQLYGDQLGEISDLFGGEEQFGQFMKPMLDYVQQMTAPIKEFQQWQADQKVEAMRTTVHGFFDDTVKSQSEFNAIYGSSNKPMTPEQSQARYQVALLADDIYAGAQAQGRQMTPKEALERAHVLQNRDKLQTLERKKIAGNIQRRSNQLTARPNGAISAGSQSQGRNAAEAAYVAKARELGIDLNG